MIVYKKMRFLIKNFHEMSLYSADNKKIKNKTNKNRKTERTLTTVIYFRTRQILVSVLDYFFSGASFTQKYFKKVSKRHLICLSINYISTHK